MEGGIEPDWVIGTSIGAINGALIAGNRARPTARPAARILGRRRQQDGGIDPLWPSIDLRQFARQPVDDQSGIPGFFCAQPAGDLGAAFALGVDKASYYTTDPLKETLGRLVDFDCLNREHGRLSVGAVNVRTSEMRYFDTPRASRLASAHVMASGALPPAFPAVRIDGEPYWDGGIYSNTPIEVVLDDVPRRNSLIDSGSAPSGCHTLTAKISESRRGLSSSTASIGVFE